MANKKVLIITYYWPPSGGSGVQRWLKFTKYLPQFGWQPVVFTPQNPDFTIKDQSLNKELGKEIEVIYCPIWEPFSLLKKINKDETKTNQGFSLEKTKRSLKDKLIIWIRGNLLIPDPRIFWVRSAVKVLNEYISKNGIDTIVTTGPPHSVHLIGLKLKQRHTSIKWLADFRDPWSNWDVLDKLMVGKIAKGIHRRLEKKVLTHADIIITIGKSLAKDFEQLGAKNMHVVTNGVDEDDFKFLSKENVLSDKFIISYFGLLNELRNPELLWKALIDLAKEDREFDEKLVINLGGVISESIMTYLQNEPTLNNKIVFHNYLSHEDAFKQCIQSTILLLLLSKTDNAKWNLPAKLYEYLATRNIILTLGPAESDASDILEELNAGATIDYNDYDKLKSNVRFYFEKFKAGQLVGANYNMEKYHRKNLTGEVAKLLDKINDRMIE